MNKSSTEQPEAIAVIGMACRFPGADSLDQFWQNLRDGVESVSFFSTEELISAGIEPALLSLPNYVRAGGLLEDVEMFDATFFGINPREAESMDAQQRVFLECAWQALEHAGYTPGADEHSVGVYAGSALSTYMFQLFSNTEFARLVGGLQIIVGNDKDYLATRTSYKLDLRGPSLNVQAACSTSLAAACLASQALLDHQCDMALAGGVTVRIPQRAGYFYQPDGMVSPDGHCRAFDARAQGFVPGSGAGVVVLKRLSDALADNDTIHAVIRGFAVNNDGSARAGYTAPGVRGQTEVIALAQMLAGVSPESITYVEAHGTATPLGDTIEIAALSEAFRTDATQFCAIGSVKTNIGHLDAAAGIASLIKAVLQLEHRQIVPSLNFKTPNPKINFANSPFYVNTTLAEWQPSQVPRRAGVNTFGVGGTNAHVVLEESPARQGSASARDYHLLLISARTQSALKAASANMLEYLQRNTDLNIADVAYTSQAGRKRFEHRNMLVCRSREDAIEALADPSRSRVASSEGQKSRPLAFLFTGPGAGYVNPGSELYRAEPTYRASVDQCSELLKAEIGFDEAAQDPARPELAEPTAFVSQYALARLLMEWGIEPAAMIGHGIGEYIAASISGVLSLADALSLVAARSRVHQHLSRGPMLAVALPEHEARALAKDGTFLAAIYTPSCSVISGPSETLEELTLRLRREGIECSSILGSQPLWQASTKTILEEFTEVAKRVHINSPRIRYVSGLTGAWVQPQALADGTYWVRHLRQTLRFGDGLHTVLKEFRPILLELGPAQMLRDLGEGAFDSAGECLRLSAFARAGDPHSDSATLFEMIGRLWLSGIKVDWRAFHAHEQRSRVPLPTYPFERRRYWVEAAAPNKSVSFITFKKPDVADWFLLPAWKPTPALEIEFIKDLITSDWAVFSDESGLGQMIVNRLRQLGQSVAVIYQGDEFIEVAPDAFTIAPTSRDDYSLLVRELKRRGRELKRVLNLWAVSGPASVQDYAQDRVAGAEVVFYSLVFLAQALGEEAHHDAVRIGIITDGLQDIGGGTTCPEKALVLGPCLVIPQEYSHVKCQSIDIGLDRDPGLNDALADRLIAELASEPLSACVAYRGSSRWCQEFKPRRIEKPPDPIPQIRKNGVYLITGGLGGIGLVIAEYLARKARARLVLVSRTPIPERQWWERWLVTHDGDDLVSRKIQQLRMIEGWGSQVLTLHADVSDREQMRGVIDRTYAQFGRIHGVIHAAGVASACPTQQLIPAIAEAVLAPKVRGAIILDQLLSKMRPDFFVCCSSLVSVTGAQGRADYCAANAFLDAFARSRDSERCRYLSINWDTWQEVGMAFNALVPAEMEPLRQDALRRGILPREGVDVFVRLLAQRAPQVAVVASLLPGVEQPGGQYQKRNPQAETAPLTSHHTRPELTQPYVRPTRDIERRLVEIWQELLGIEPIGVHDNFFELGGDSLLVMQLTSRLRDEFHVDLPTAFVFDAPTIALLAAQTKEDDSGSAKAIDRLLDLFEQLSEAELELRLPAILAAGAPQEESR